MNTSDERLRYFADMRAKAAQLAGNLNALERRARGKADDATAYVRSEQQFERLRQRHAAFSDAFTVDSRDATQAALEWAELKTRLDLAWRELLTDFDQIQQTFPAEDAPTE
jgi:hypothetical protein